jgi:hypothetical protein
VFAIFIWGSGVLGTIVVMLLLKAFLTGPPGIGAGAAKRGAAIGGGAGALIPAF